MANMADNTSELAHIIIDRTSDKDIKMRELDAFIDEVFVDKLMFNSSFADDVPPGEHTIKVTNHLHTRKLHVNLKAGQTLHLMAGNYFDALGGVMMPSLGFGPYKVFLREAADDSPLSKTKETLH